MNDIWWYEIHCPDCGTLMRKKSYKACPDCGNPQAICLPPESFGKVKKESTLDTPSQECL